MAWRGAVFCSRSQSLQTVEPRHNPKLPGPLSTAMARTAQSGRANGLYISLSYKKGQVVINEVMRREELENWISQVIGVEQVMISGRSKKGSNKGSESLISIPTFLTSSIFRK